MFATHGRLFALITNTLAKDKEIEDRWRKFPRPISARNLSNYVEDEVVDALIQMKAHLVVDLSLHRSARGLVMEELFRAVVGHMRLRFTPS